MLGVEAAGPQGLVPGRISGAVLGVWTGEGPGEELGAEGEVDLHDLAESDALHNGVDLL